MTPDDVDPSTFDAVFYVGGHGTMWDFPDDDRLARIAGAIADAGGVVAAVCHGPAGLVGVRRSDGSFLVEGRQVAAFTDAEELAVGLTDVVPFSLERRLVERGAVVRTAPNFEANVVRDGHLVTGQNPASATGVASAVVEALVVPARTG